MKKAFLNLMLLAVIAIVVYVNYDITKGLKYWGHMDKSIPMEEMKSHVLMETITVPR